MRKRRLADAPCPIADLSADGTMVACGTSEGDLVVVSTRGLRPLKYVRGAHMVYGTALTFSPDSCALLSVSSDASAVVVPLRRAAPAAAGGGLHSAAGEGRGAGRGGGAGVMMVLVSVLVAAVAVLLGLARYMAQQGHLHPTHLPDWIPQELVRLITG